MLLKGLRLDKKQFRDEKILENFEERVSRIYTAEKL